MEERVVVIGGGIVGTAVAHQLQLFGADTVLVERDVAPQGASAFSFASLSALDEPQRDVYLLKNHGMLRWRELAKEFGDDLGVRFPGELRWAETADGAKTLISLMERAKARGYPVRTISLNEIAEHEPTAQPHAAQFATWAPDDGQVEPLRAIQVLRSAFLSLGGSVLGGRAVLMIEDQGVVVRVGDHHLQASSVVVAAGAETTALVERFGWEIPMDPSPGLLCVIDPLPPFLMGTVYVYPESGAAIHLRQLKDGTVLIGERAQDAVAKEPTSEHAAMLLRQARRAFPVLEAASVRHFTVEWRPMPRDGMPIVGGLPGLRSVYLATGHGGVTMAPALGTFIAQELVEGTEVDRLKPFRPARFAAHSVDAYRSVEETFSGGSEVFIG